MNTFKDVYISEGKAEESQKGVLGERKEVLQYCIQGDSLICLSASFESF
jgi:hypothetical protein